LWLRQLQILIEGKIREIDNPQVLAEVTAALPPLPRLALVTNDVETLNSLFRDDPRTLRYGGGENLYGFEAIKAFRAGRSPAGLARRTDSIVITTYGNDFAVASTLFYSDTAPARWGVRCKPGCVSPRAGASSRPMSASSTRRNSPLA